MQVKMQVPQRSVELESLAVGAETQQRTQLSQ